MLEPKHLRRPFLFATLEFLAKFQTTERVARDRDLFFGQVLPDFTLQFGTQEKSQS